MLSQSSERISLLTPNNNPLIDLGITSVPLWAQVMVIAISALLGVCAYTDAYRGWKIKNEVVGAIAAISFGSSLFLFPEPLTHFVIALGCIVGIFIIYLSGAFAEGDLKLYAALALLLAQGIVVLIFMSWCVIIAYSIPTMVRSLRSGTKGKKRGERLGKVPAGPGIAAAFPWFLFFCGYSALASVLLLSLISLTVLICLAIFGTLEDDEAVSTPAEAITS